MRENALNLNIDGLGSPPICDIVGTGGDGHNTFNVSTTAGIVASGAGARVFKVSQTKISPSLSLEMNNLTLKYRVINSTVTKQLHHLLVQQIFYFP